jgi:hypothetical protein
MIIPFANVPATHSRQQGFGAAHRAAPFAQLFASLSGALFHKPTIAPANAPKTAKLALYLGSYVKANTTNPVMPPPIAPPEIAARTFLVLPAWALVCTEGDGLLLVFSDIIVILYLWLLMGGSNWSGTHARHHHRQSSWWQRRY